MAQAARAVKGVGDDSEAAAKKSDGAFSRLARTAQQNSESWTSAGATLTGFGAATVGALGLATKAAMDWESSWAGVQKTVDGTAPQMAALEQGLRSMARELPASHQEIAAVAEAAGQLGIETPNVLGFTRTMIDMGESTNMSAEEAATSLARFMNVMGTSQADVGRLGASVVGLGNNFATTESEIVEMSQRLAGAGAQASMTEGDVMGIAAAMSSVGIEAEAGGSAMSQTMKRIGKSVDEGGESLELFAQVSGMSAQEFSAAWKSDPAMALDAFITGLSGVEAQGMTTNGVLADLGITGIREADALLRLSAAAGQGADGMSLLAGAVEMGNSEFDKGTALIEEASKRYETAESRIAMARNALVDMGISVGGVVLPAVAELADGAGDLAGWFADLPAPVHEAAAGLGAVVGTGALAAGTFLMLAPRVADTWDAFKRLDSSTNGTASKLGKIGVAVGVTAAALPILIAAGREVEDALRGIDRAALDIGMDEMASRTLKAADATSVYDAVLGDLADSGALNTSQFENLGVAVDKVANMDAFGKIGRDMGLAAGGWDLMAERFELFGESLAMIAQTDLPQAQASFSAFWEEAYAGGATFEEVLSVMPAFRNELARVANQMGLDGTDSAVLYRIAIGELAPVVDEATGAIVGAEEAAGQMAAGMDGATGAVEEQVDALAELQDLLSDTANLLLGVRGSERDFQAAIDDATASVEEHGRTLDRATEAGRANESALDGIAEAAHNWANAAEESGASAQELDGIMQAGRDNFIRTAEAMGMSTEEATRLADELQLIPDFVETEVEVETQAAKDELARLWEEQELHPPQLPVTADTDPAKGEVAEFSGLVGDNPAHVPVQADTAPASNDVATLVSEIEAQGGSVGVSADPTEGYMQVDSFVAAVEQSGGTVTINGNTMQAGDALMSILGTIDSSDGTVTINGESYPADQALEAAIAYINASGGTVEIDGNNAPANAATDSAKRKADGTTGTIDVNANTGGAESSINHTARGRSSNVNQTASTGAAESALNRTARDRTSRITVFQSVRTTGSATARAMGGPVFGPGTGTSDSIPALLSNGEHVITAKEVAQAGGQDAIYRMREAIRSGFKFANGGAVEKRGYAPVPPMAPASSLGQRQVSASVDTAAIASAVAGAISGYQPIVQVGDREFVGVMRRAGRMGAR